MGRSRALGAVGFVVALACGDSENENAKSTCTQTDPTSCAAGTICEQVGEGTLECLPPVIVSGRVLDALSGEALTGATVVGLDANGAARTRVARSGAGGAYELPISIRRNADRTPSTESITLRVAASAHQPFPVAPRPALPIELALAQPEAPAVATSDGDKLPYRIHNAATEVTLLPLPAGELGGVTLEGRVAAPAPAGVLIVALTGSAVDATAIADSDGSFVLFNVTPGSVKLEGYRAGIAIEPATVQVPASGLTDVSLSASSAELATVSGSVNIVNAEGGLTSSVILVVASTFDPVMVRGEAPAGLRVGNVGGAFRIPSVPPGRYAVLAAFENDRLVRDPDASIAGTAIVFVDVPATGSEVTLAQSFKITQALEVIAPGAQSITEVQPGPLTLTWADDSSEDGYELRVYDALGALVHEDLAVARVSGAPSVQYAFDASRLTRGMLYQFRVFSFRERQQRTRISASEDLRGVFQIAH